MMRIGSCAACVSAWLLFAERAPAEEVVDPEVDADEVSEADAAAEFDAIVVTGTHIKRIQVEGPLPISVIERDELLASGQANLADAIRDLPYNSFGSVADAPLDHTPNLSLPSLRGLGSKYTLSLLDGHRLPNLALDDNGGASASVTGIPLAAIDRIEVLRDGASAIYGSDAIGGVINLVTRRNDTDPELEFQVEYPEQDGGQTHRASIVYGRTHDRGHWLLAAEAQDREILLGKDRDYLLELAGFNQNGNPGTYRRFDPETDDYIGPFRADARCPTATDSDPLFPGSTRLRFGANELCGYRLRDLNTERAGFEGRSLFATARHEFSESLSAFGRIMVVGADGETQSAPTPTNGLYIAPDNPNNPTRGELGPELGADIDPDLAVGATDRDLIQRGKGVAREVQRVRPVRLQRQVGEQHRGRAGDIEQRLHAITIDQGRCRRRPAQLDRVADGQGAAGLHEGPARHLDQITVGIGIGSEYCLAQRAVANDAAVRQRIVAAGDGESGCLGGRNPDGENERRQMNDQRQISAVAHGGAPVAQQVFRGSAAD